MRVGHEVSSVAETAAIEPPDNNDPITELNKACICRSIFFGLFFFWHTPRFIPVR